MLLLGQPRFEKLVMSLKATDTFKPKLPLMTTTALGPEAVRACVDVDCLCYHRGLAHHVLKYESPAEVALSLIDWE